MKIEFSVVENKSLLNREDCAEGTIVESCISGQRYIVGREYWVKVDPNRTKIEIIKKENLNGGKQWIVLPKGASVTLISEEGV
ncbi:MAG: hypothetical protein ACRYGG_00835 [Janthinobacterium lividum]